MLAIDEKEKKFLDLLDLWVEWMSKADGRGRSATRVAVFGNVPSNYATADDDSDALYEKNRMDPALVFNACVDSLYTHERIAVYKSQGLRKEYGVRWMPYETALAEGMDRLRALVARRC